MTQPDAPSPLDRINEVLRRLRDPLDGCPWDLEQTPDTLKMYLLEEAYELVSAILDQGGSLDRDAATVRDELGDCFFLLSFITHIYQDAGLFSLDDVLLRAADKMIGRHPHVFGDREALKDSDEVRLRWHELKNEEKSSKGDFSGSFLSSVPQNLPALLRAHRLSERAGRVGFDWDDQDQVLKSLDQEVAELKAALEGGKQDLISDEIGDVFFTLTNLARHLRINSEEALQKTNKRFLNRFAYIEETLTAQGKTLEETTLAEMDRLWNEAKDKGL